MRKIAIVFLLWSFFSPSFAITVFKAKQQDGGVVFSDRHISGAKQEVKIKIQDFPETKVHQYQGEYAENSAAHRKPIVPQREPAGDNRDSKEQEYYQQALTALLSKQRKLAKQLKLAQSFQAKIANHLNNTHSVNAQDHAYRTAIGRNMNSRVAHLSTELQAIENKIKFNKNILAGHHAVHKLHFSAEEAKKLSVLFPREPIYTR